MRVIVSALATIVQARWLRGEQVRFEKPWGGCLANGAFTPGGPLGGGSREPGSNSKAPRSGRADGVKVPARKLGNEG